MLLISYRESVSLRVTRWSKCAYASLPVRLSTVVSCTRWQGSWSLSCFPPMALSARRLPSLLRVPASPVPRSQRYYEGATTSHPRIHGRLLVCSRSPRDPPRFVSAVALPKGRRSLRARPLGCAGGPLPACSRVDANGISQVFRRSIPCLCSVPGPRSNRRVLATHAHVDAAPAIRTAKASAMADFGANPQLRHLLPYASRVALPPHLQGLLPAGRLSLCREGVEPSGPLREVSAHPGDHPPLLLS